METVKGLKDFSGDEAVKRARVREIIVSVFEKYGFEPVEAPIIEYEKFVKGENVNDESVSDIFKLKDKGKRNLALRYELTFQLKRLMKNKKLPYKRYQVGEVFRDEPISRNRFRQFTQCDIDIISSGVKDNAEILAITKDVLNELGIKFVIYFNNRKLLNEILNREGIKKKEKVIREIDKLDKLSEKEVRKNLKKFKAEKLIGILKKPENYFKKYKSYSEVKELKKYCKFYGVEVKFLPSLARGLSYYNASVFEVKTKGIRETITAGGAYMFNKVQCTGISFGLDRLSMLAKIENKREKFMIISLGEDKVAIRIGKKLRNQGKIVNLWFGKLGKGMDYANSKDFDKVIFVGSKEVKKKKFKIKDMGSGKEKFIQL